MLDHVREVGWLDVDEACQEIDANGESHVSLRELHRLLGSTGLSKHRAARAAAIVKADWGGWVNLSKWLFALRGAPSRWLEEGEEWLQRTASASQRVDASVWDEPQATTQRRQQSQERRHAEATAKLLHMVWCAP